MERNRYDDIIMCVKPPPLVIKRQQAHYPSLSWVDYVIFGWPLRLTNA
jgi:hypothetical protein